MAAQDQTAGVAQRLARRRQWAAAAGSNAETAADHQVADWPSHQRGVEVSLSPEITALGKYRIAFDIEVTMRDGQTHRQRWEGLRCAPGDPLTEEELEKKFRDATAAALGDESRERFLTLVRYLGELESVSELVRPLCA